MFSYNNAYQESIATSPFMLTYGAHRRVPGLVAPNRYQADRGPGVHAFKRHIDRRLDFAKECICKGTGKAGDLLQPTQEGGRIPG